MAVIHLQVLGCDRVLYMALQANLYSLDIITCLANTIVATLCGILNTMADWKFATDKPLAFVSSKLLNWV